MTSSGLRSSQIAALALGIGVFFTAQTVLMALAGRGVVSLEWDVMQELLYWAVWAALAPVIRASIVRWPLQARPFGRAAAVHALVALPLAATQTVVAFGLHYAVLAAAGVAPGGPGPADAAPLTLFLFLQRVRPSLVWGTFMGVFLYALVVGLDAAIRIRRLYAGAQLDALRSQLRPHFLFNTLNAISVLTLDDPARARQMVLRLSTLLRRSLDEKGREVPLRQELAYLNEYLDIQRVRFGDRLEVGVTIDEAAADARVPAFLLQPLVENAMEHAVALREQPTVVALRAERVGDTLHISVEDNGPGPSDAAPLREGVGLRNTRELLAQLYGGAGTVTLRGTGTAPHTGACADVTIPFTVRPA